MAQNSSGEPVTPQYARSSKGQIEINGPMGWEARSRLTALCDLDVLRSAKSIHHATRIAELEAALGIT